MVVVLNVAPLMEANRAEVPGLAVADKLALTLAGLVAVQWQELAAVLALARLG